MQPLSRCATAPPGGASAAAAVSRYGPSREKANLENPQIFQICEIKNNFSAEYAQSETEGILNHLLEETRKYMNHLGDYDVIVIGAGHAGIEAAHAAATLGARTAVFTMSLDAIGNMPCNPSIGGTAKGTLVRELDALGGVMGLAADATYLQSRMLNKGKGPAVHALRVQTDRKRYHEYMKHALELTPGLAIHQAEVVSIETENGRVKGVVTQLNGEYSAKCVVIATGTNLGGKIFVGDAWYASGPDGMHAANALTDSLKAAGLPLRRFKTGTPARVHRRSIDFSKLECQPGDPDNELQPFSFMTDAPMHNKVECWIAYTNPETHRIILDNIQRSPLYGGMIEGVGPRYCPSIEDKVVRFAGKDRHPIFVEPCGENTEEMYLQGASSSLPEDVQNAFYRSIKGFENIEIMRPAYAIEYDCVDPTSLEATLESKVVRGLYGAGQFNGTSGYEEAAAQGLLAGLNAACNALGKEQLILPRHTSYLGTLVDDLVTKGVMDPYRMMTSRSEYRLTLRQDNADQRLTPIGREYGLVQDDRWAKYQHTQSILEAERRRLHETHLRTADLRAAMEAAGLAPAAEGGIAEELLRRPEISYPLLAGVIGWGEEITPMLAERLETEKKELVPEYKKNPEMEMPTVEVNGQECVGMIEIPALGLKLPVISEWSDAKLKKAPCRYSGSAYLKNMIIAGHNYRTHFSGIKRLNPGDSVVFTDADGNVFSYEVTEIETVGGYDIEKMEDGDWDLTLFTCTNKGKARAAVRCREIEE